MVYINGLLACSAIDGKTLNAFTLEPRITVTMSSNPEEMSQALANQVLQNSRLFTLFRGLIIPKLGKCIVFV